MGSERKSKKRHSPSSSASEDEKGKSEKKHRSSSSKSDKKDKVKTKKSHKHSDKGKKSEEKHDRKRPKHIHPSFQELSKDDYFSKNNEFATWLSEEKGVFFSDLSSEAARELFLRFIKDWNSHKLESRYYKGIEKGPRTAHSWKITNEKRS